MNEGTKIGLFLKSRCTEPANSGKVSIQKFYEKYGCVCPQELLDLYAAFSGGFVERFPNESVLFYSPETLYDAAEDLIPIDIPATGLLPMADFKDNQFLCYHPMKKMYVLFSAIDEIAVFEESSLPSLLKELGMAMPQ